GFGSGRDSDLPVSTRCDPKWISAGMSSPADRTTVSPFSRNAYTTPSRSARTFAIRAPPIHTGRSTPERADRPVFEINYQATVETTGFFATSRTAGPPAPP